MDFCILSTTSGSLQILQTASFLPFLSKMSQTAALTKGLGPGLKDVLGFLAAELSEIYNDEKN